MKVTKQKISKILSKELNISINEAKLILNNFFEIIKTEVKTKNLKIKGFGSFITKKTAKRIGRNPKTKESYIIYPRKKVSLIVSKKVREDLNWININYY